VYGVESASRGLGGLAAQAPAGDQFLGPAMAIRPRATPLVGGRSQTGLHLPYTGAINTQTALPVVSGQGSAVEVPPGRMMTSWRSVLDFHNSPAPWILLGMLLLYGWLHASVRASAGRARVSAAV
jgi:hypothetical protein